MVYFRDLPRLRQTVQRTATVFLLAATGVVLLNPDIVVLVTGVRGVPVLTPPDELPPLSREDVTPFFESRNHVEVRVAETTTLRQFLDRNRLNKPFHRKQIVDQLGNASPDAEIAAGTMFRLRLTPVAEDVPGTSPAEGAP